MKNRRKQNFGGEADNMQLVKEDTQRSNLNGKCVFNILIILFVFMLEPVLNRVWYYEPRDFNSDCKQSLSFLSLQPRACEKLKEHAIEGQKNDAFFS